MDRREFLGLAGGTLLLTRLPTLQASPADSADSRSWRRFALTYHVELAEPGLEAELWLPLPQNFGDYQRAEIPQWQSNADTAEVRRLGRAEAFFARWRGAAERRASVRIEVATRDRQIDWHRPPRPTPEQETVLERYLQPTERVPLDGIVRDTALAASAGAETPLQKARAIYDWVVEHSFRDPKVRGCGLGDVKSMLESGNLGGKCVDINTLYVGLCRAVGIPAREIYGIRVADSRLFKSLGRSGDVTGAQHCRAEFYVAEFGWVPVDPADVRKAVLEEKLPLDDPKIAELRERLFGSWEMNWVAFNDENDLRFGPSMMSGFFMYPQAQVGGKVLDSLDPEHFSYRIESTSLS